MVEMKQPLSSTGHVISSYLTFMTLAVKRLKTKQVCEYQTLFYKEIMLLLLWSFIFRPSELQISCQNF